MIAGHALKANITTLGPLVLPVSEQLLFFISLVMRKARSPCLPAGSLALLSRVFRWLRRCGSSCCSA